NFIINTVAAANITTSVYDHLFLTEEEIQERKVLFNALSVGYTVSSEKLNRIYLSISDYPKPNLVIEDGVDLEFFAPVNLERLADEEREIVVGWVGNSKWNGDGIDHKGINTIIKPAVKSLKTEGCKVRGFYADRQERWIPHNEMDDYYNSIDIYVCASDNEGKPDPALESMACGLPIITTDVGIFPQLFGRLQKEYILPARGIEELKKKLRELIQSPHKRVALSKENLERIQSWSWKYQSEKWRAFFQIMLSGSQPELAQRNALRKQFLESYLVLERENRIREFQVKLQESENRISEKDARIKELESALHKSESQISEKNILAKQLQFALWEMEDRISEKDKFIDELQFALREMEDRISEKDKFIDELQLILIKAVEQTETTKRVLEQKQLELETAQMNLQNTNETLRDAMNTISAMESSKFWKARNLYFSLKTFKNLDK
ncbi:MAG: glycosyltransferase, partial [Pyrinomonadaceae bacterium]